MVPYLANTSPTAVCICALSETSESTGSSGDQVHSAGPQTPDYRRLARRSRRARLIQLDWFEVAFPAILSAIGNDWAGRFFGILGNDPGEPLVREALKRLTVR